MVSPKVPIDAPEITISRADTVKNKKFLLALYRDWYANLLRATEGVPAGTHLEIGSGPGFLREMAPHVVTSEIIMVNNVNVILSAEHIAFADDSLSAIYMTDVLHHIPRPRAFFAEAQRCLKHNGRVVMIEPFNSPWGRFIWQNFHHEPFLPDAGWELPGNGPLSDANGAAPWIFFRRDRDQFEREFPGLRIDEIRPLMPFAYIISGGFSMRALLPGICYSAVRKFEGLLGRLENWLGMFAFISLTRVK